MNPINSTGSVPTDPSVSNRRCSDDKPESSEQMSKSGDGVDLTQKLPISLRSVSANTGYQPVTFNEGPVNLCQDNIETHTDKYESRHICGPTAVANTLAPLLGRKLPDDQHKLVLELAEAFGMDQKKEFGAGAIEVMAGIRSYLEDHGYGTPGISYYGWRAEYPCAKKRFDHVKSKDPLSQQEILNHIKESDGGWLNIGFFTFNKETEEYTRKGGHWVTLAGYFDSTNDQGDAGLIIHDPAKRAHVPGQDNQYLINRLPSGKLKDRERSRDAEGFLCLGSSFKFPEDERNINTAIIDAAVFLKFPKNKASNG